MKGLRIRTITGAEFDVYGAVEHNTATGIYYCNGESWPAEIVKEVLM
ncbi:MAG: hypothetical protein FWG94_11995 [Oscillospiraceae bacterium]|nr:hypothetical protein [Oscillospiraceae bacterium]